MSDNFKKAEELIAQDRLNTAMAVLAMEQARAATQQANALTIIAQWCEQNWSLR